MGKSLRSILCCCCLLLCQQILLCLQGLDLADVYLGIAHGRFLYHIRSVVCYYGQHYIAFVLMSDSLWYMFDDAHILCIRLWADVVSRCELGRIQASVLFFEQLRV